MRKTPYDPPRSSPRWRGSAIWFRFVIHPSVGPKTFKEMVDTPSRIPANGLRIGRSRHVDESAVETLKYKAGIDILHVPYRGSADVLHDLLPTTVQMMNEIVVMPHVKAGKLTLLNMN